MIGAALDQEWIESDPAHRLKYRPPPTKGWRSWTPGERRAFEEWWPVGSTPRLCYALALWLDRSRSFASRYIRQKLGIIHSPRRNGSHGPRQQPLDTRGEVAPFSSRQTLLAHSRKWPASRLSPDKTGRRLIGCAPLYRGPLYRGKARLRG
jgi:hypothetical protein